jgi:hypothetical protein
MAFNCGPRRLSASRCNGCSVRLFRIICCQPQGRSSVAEQRPFNVIVIRVFNRLRAGRTGLNCEKDKGLGFRCRRSARKMREKSTGDFKRLFSVGQA